jgi:seryl-tRNA synthetase
LVWIGEGLAVLSGDLLRVKRALEKYWFDYAISELKATEIENPALWSSEVAEKSKYLTDFPHEATFILGAKRDNISIGNVEKLVSQENFLLHDINLSDALPSLSLVGFCQPSVCTSCYYAIGKRMSASNEIYTTYNRVFRNEGTKSLERLLSFSVRDIMVVGNDAFVRETRDVFLKKALRFIEELNFEAKIISATDPFFATKSSKIFMQKTGDLKHEIQAWVPFEKKAIAVGSINLHLDTFGRRFSMKNQDDFSFSSCFGIGFERLTYALFSQNGPNLLEWDETLLERLALI